MKHLPLIIFQSINHRDQRYDTAGDYTNTFFNDGVDIYVSKLEKPEYELAVLIHELIEYFLITQKGIKIKDIDRFDTELVRERYRKDPGLDPNAPYHKEHKQATKIEKEVIKILGQDWKIYNNSFNKLIWRSPSPRNKKKKTPKKG